MSATKPTIEKASRRTAKARDFLCTDESRDCTVVLVLADERGTTHHCGPFEVRKGNVDTMLTLLALSGRAV